MMIHDITEKAGPHKRRKRIGRGPGSGNGKTAGRGHKGARSRAGFSRKLHHEGGQNPFFMRLPKVGFSNVQFALEFAIVNLRVLEARFDDGAQVDAALLAKHGLIRSEKMPVKVLGTGELTKKLTLTVAAVSGSARQKVEKAGGSITLVPAKKDRRPKGVKKTDATE
ncbi:MAG: 50S ribosomal protein L15 [Planctomycetota bacterium]